MSESHACPTKFCCDNNCLCWCTLELVIPGTKPYASKQVDDIKWVKFGFAHFLHAESRIGLGFNIAYTKMYCSYCDGWLTGDWSKQCVLEGEDSATGKDHWNTGTQTVVHWMSGDLNPWSVRWWGGLRYPLHRRSTHMLLWARMEPSTRKLRAKW